MAQPEHCKSDEFWDVGVHRCISCTTCKAGDESCSFLCQVRSPSVTTVTSDQEQGHSVATVATVTVFVVIFASVSVAILACMLIRWCRHCKLSSDKSSKKLLQQYPPNIPLEKSDNGEHAKHGCGSTLLCDGVHSNSSTLSAAPCEESNVPDSFVLVHEVHPTVCSDQTHEPFNYGGLVRVPSSPPGPQEFSIASKEAACLRQSTAVYESGLVSLQETDVAAGSNGAPVISRHSSSELNLVSSDFENRMKMFGWLNSQPWVTEYSEDPDGGVKIAVEGIDDEPARRRICEAAEGIGTRFAFTIVQPMKGNFIPCPGSAMTEATSVFCLSPGMQLYSPRMEPASPGERCESGYALFAGSVSGFPSGVGEYGITVGHLFEAVGTECHRRASPWFPVNMLVGSCALKLSCVDIVSSIRKTTADLALIKLNYCSLNVIHVDGREYKLKLYRGKLHKQITGTTVAIVTKDGDVRCGEVADFLFTIDKLGLHNTISIVDRHGKSSRLNDLGDSGALVTSVPDRSGPDVLYVYGMVIGYYESQDGLQSNTVAIRLWDVLQCISDSAELNFGTAYQSESETDTSQFPVDSGYTTH